MSSEHDDANGHEPKPLSVWGSKSPQILVPGVRVPFFFRYQYCTTTMSSTPRRKAAEPCMAAPSAAHSTIASQTLPAVRVAPAAVDHSTAASSAAASAEESQCLRTLKASIDLSKSLDDEERKRVKHSLKKQTQLFEGVPEAQLEAFSASGKACGRDWQHGWRSASYGPLTTRD